MISLPTSSGEFETYELREPVLWERPASASATRIGYAAAHVVADPLADNSPGRPAAIDWDATLRFRRHLWSYGLRVADAMDTAQRGMGLDWAAIQELVRRSAAEARSFGDPAGLLACGAGTDQAPAAATLDEIVAAYSEQIDLVQETGATVILMASRRLAALAAGPDDYQAVYGRLLQRVDRPAILHWLGDMFDPALTGYWGSADLDTATASLLELIGDHAALIDGVKVSLLDADREIAIRSALPDGVKLYTGDDYNYPSLIGSGSHALLGVFDAIAPAAAAALQALDAGDLARYEEVFGPTVPLARKIFEPPTYHYKTGLVFLAWLAGHQTHFRMVGGLESARSVPHLVRLFELADQAGLLPDPELAVARTRAWLTVQGVPS